MSDRRAPVTARPAADPDGCTFCHVDSGDILASNADAVGFLASYPVSPGHALIVPKRHEPDFFSLTEEEAAAIIGLVGSVRRRLDDRFRPDGYNLGVNAGKAAGQTIMHAHLHVIPRYEGDVADPRGGVRWILPKTAKYWRDT